MTVPAENIARLRQLFYQRIAPRHLKPLWEVLHSLVPPQPQPKCVPVLWKYSDLRGPLLEAGDLISAREATRRVLILENPAFAGESKITNSLYAGVQLLKPGEVAPAHRHTQSALRFVLEGRGAFTAVDGERAYMEPGDLILTPSWTFHDHGSETTEPVMWLDGLDIPIVQLLDTGFCEDLSQDQQQVARPVGDALARYGANMLPVDYQPQTLTSPVFSYPYARTREALERLAKGSPVDACHGFKMRFINPATGGHALPTIATFMQLLPKGFRGSACRSTDATVFAGVEGSGRSRVGNETFEWGPRDIFVVPSWVPCTHEADQDAVLFSYSDRVVQEQLGLWQESRG
ncbi:gentisate 1,2-dioxygenase [Povalibacter sp.]|uniref:gentisate 1,2-dioxygenase n=1 Tax=Povalibacter sp. TaxID=1962978 RepID=UPI002F3E7A70